MKYYSFADIMRAYRISKTFLKLKCQNGKLEHVKQRWCKTNASLFKYLIPESELFKIAKYKKAGIEIEASEEWRQEDE